MTPLDALMSAFTMLAELPTAVIIPFDDTVKVEPNKVSMVRSFTGGTTLLAARRPSVT